jgi:hypothetical protein
MRQINLSEQLPEFSLMKIILKHMMMTTRMENLVMILSEMLLLQEGQMAGRLLVMLKTLPVM